MTRRWAANPSPGRTVVVSSAMATWRRRALLGLLGLAAGATLGCQTGHVSPGWKRTVRGYQERCKELLSEYAPRATKAVESAGPPADLRFTADVLQSGTYEPHQNGPRWCWVVGLVPVGWKDEWTGVSDPWPDMRVWTAPEPGEPTRMYFGSAWDQERLLAHVRAQGTILRETDAVDQDRMGPVDRHTIVVQEPGGSRVLLVTRRYGEIEQYSCGARLTGRRVEQVGVFEAACNAMVMTTREHPEWFGLH